MAMVITISGTEKSGALARIYAFLARKGYSVRGHHASETPSGLKLLQLIIDDARIDKEQISAEIHGLSPEYHVVSVAAESAKEASETSERKHAHPGSAAIKEMAAQYPDLAPLVLAYGEAFAPEARDAELLDAGKRIGAYIYNKEWSLGTPLKMPAALHRALVPALEKFGEVISGDLGVAFQDSPFYVEGNPCCEFVTGFMQGFLDAGPSTKHTRVQHATCKAKGDTHCAYTVEQEQ